MINAHWEPRTFQIQDGDPRSWEVAIDTGLPNPDDIRDVGAEAALASRDYTLRPRSVAVLVKSTRQEAFEPRPSRGPRRNP